MGPIFLEKSDDLARVKDFVNRRIKPNLAKKIRRFPSPPSHHFLRKSGHVGQFLDGARKCNFVWFLAQNHIDNLRTINKKYYPSRRTGGNYKFPKSSALIV